MSVLRLIVLAGGLLCAAASSASAAIVIDIDKSTQVMTVSQDGRALYNWPVSTGQRGYDTPSGQFKPFRMEKDHFSREWDDAPMPHSIFFTTRGHAIHGTEHTRNIGRPASHGCVRLSRDNARTLFNMVKAEGMANVRVVLHGATGGGNAPMVRRAPRSYDDDDEMTTSTVRPRRAAPYERDGWGYRTQQQDDYEDRGYDRGYYRPAPQPFFGSRPYSWN